MAGYEHHCVTVFTIQMLCWEKWLTLGMKNCTCFAGLFLFMSTFSFAQTKDTVNWKNFDALEASLNNQPKKVLLFFYTSWCTYCHKMENEIFTKDDVVNVLNQSFYAVKMDAESMDSIKFDGQLFVNSEAKRSRNPIHDLAKIFVMQNGAFTPPVTVILDENFQVVQRKFEYLDTKKLLKLLN